MSSGAIAVTVVIPVRNGRAHLGDAIDSSWAQTLRPAAVVVVDDGSSDGSGDLARSLGATVVAQPPLGPGAARNLGVATASTEWVAFLDADDRMVPGRLAAQAAVLLADDDLSGVLGLMRLFADGAPAQGAPEACLLPSALTVRRRAFLDSGGFDPSLPAGEFVDWMARCRQAGRRFEVVDALVVERRVHAGNLTRDPERLRAGYLAVARSAVERRRRRDVPPGPGGSS